MLLGCQGWRRFAEQDPQRFAQKQQPGHAPIFLANAAPTAQRLQAEQQEIDKLDQTFVVKVIDAQRTLAAKETAVVAMPDFVKNVGKMEQQVQVSQNEINNLQQRLRQTTGVLWQFGLGGGMLAILFIGFFLISVGLRRLSEGRAARPWLGAGLGLLSLLFLGSIVGTFTLMGEPILDDWRADMKAQHWQAAKVMAPAPAKGQALPVAETDTVESLSEDTLAAPQRPGIAKAAWQKQTPMAQAPANLLDDPQDGQAGPMWQIAEAQNERLLRQQGNYQALLEKKLGRRVQLPAVNQPCVVREYAHHHKPAQEDGGRDFADTVYWHPVLVLPDGKAEVAFELLDAVSRYEVLVLSHTFDGRLGANRATLTAKLPIRVEPSLPAEVGAGDQIVVPVDVCNEKAADTKTLLSTRVRGMKIEDQSEREMLLKANENRREFFHCTPAIAEGAASFRTISKMQGGADAVERKLKIVPGGFPVVHSISGVIENSPIHHAIDLPEAWVRGSLRVQAHFYPSPLAELQSGLEALAREPAGTFEQNLASTYANVLILNYMKQPVTHQDPLYAPFPAHIQANSELEKRARRLLQLGYPKLANFGVCRPRRRQARLRMVRRRGSPAGCADRRCPGADARTGQISSRRGRCPGPLRKIPPRPP